jgi:hypothetical protein
MQDILPIRLSSIAMQFFSLGVGYANSFVCLVDSTFKALGYALTELF